MNGKLERLIDWANESGVCIANAQIDARHTSLTFYQAREKHEDFLALKKAIGMFEKKGNAPYIRLEKTVSIEYSVDGEPFIDDWSLDWQGAFECKALGYDCGPADFADGPRHEPEPEVPQAEIDRLSDNAVEDYQLNRQ